MIRVEVVNTFLVNMGKEFVILLRGTDDRRTLPISIGQLEAQSIALEINRIAFPRPLTHDLFKNLILELNGKVLRTEICALKDETFYARLFIEAGGRTISMDARPSDAIAMALRFSAPIFVDEEVMNEAGVIIPEEQETAIEGNMELSGNKESQNEPTQIDILRKKLQCAIEEERYEDAAHIRDEINRLTASN